METNIDQHTTNLHPTTVFKTRYSTSLDKRGFIPVFEYQINGQPIMWDCETREVFLTGIWKALGHTKVDVIKTVHSNPHIKVKRIRGGLLKIQGTWVSYEDARSLCIRAAWIIRQQLIPIFGADIVEDCLPPDHPNYRVVRLETQPLIIKKRRYTIKAPSAPSLQHITYSSPSSSPPPTPCVSSTSPSHAFSLSPMALSNILNNDDSNAQDIDNDNYVSMTKEGVVPFGDDDDDLVGPSTSSTLDFQVVPVSYSTPFNGPPLSLNSSPLANDWSTLNNIGSPFFNTCDGNAIQDSIEMIQATVILHGLSRHDKFAARQTVPDKVTLNEREFYVIWD